MNRPPRQHTLKYRLCLATAVLLGAAAAEAQAVYTYTGNPFTQFSCGPAPYGGTAICQTPYDPADPTANPYTSYTASDSVVATLTFNQTLPPDLPYQSISERPGFQLVMNDGHRTLTYVGRGGAYLSTDASGRISRWNLVVNVDDNGREYIIAAEGSIVPGSSFSIDGAGLFQEPGDFAQAIDVVGTWTSPTARPAAAVKALITMLSDPALGLTKGQINSLSDKLTNALGSIDAGLYEQAIKQLNAFIKAVQSAQKTGNISVATATTLIAAATDIIGML